MSKKYVQVIEKVNDQMDKLAVKHKSIEELTKQVQRGKNRISEMKLKIQKAEDQLKESELKRLR